MGRSFEVTVRSAAPVARVWALLEDAEGWSSWARFSSSSYEEEGTEGSRHGVGALRSFGTGPIHSRERVVAHDPPTHLAYELVSGLPVKGYRADVTLSPDGDGTTVTWRSSWASAWPGVGWLMRTAVTDTAGRLAKAAEDR